MGNPTKTTAERCPFTDLHRIRRNQELFLAPVPMEIPQKKLSFLFSTYRATRLKALERTGRQGKRSHLTSGKEEDADGDEDGKLPALDEPPRAPPQPPPADAASLPPHSIPPPISLPSPRLSLPPPALAPPRRLFHGRAAAKIRRWTPHW